MRKNITVCKLRIKIFWDYGEAWSNLKSVLVWRGDLKRRSGFGRFVGEIGFGSFDLGFGEVLADLALSLGLIRFSAWATMVDLALSLGFISVQLGRQNRPSLHVRLFRDRFLR
jgi:hypothetical protein